MDSLVAFQTSISMPTRGVVSKIWFNRGLTLALFSRFCPSDPIFFSVCVSQTKAGRIIICCFFSWLMHGFDGANELRFDDVYMLTYCRLSRISHITVPSIGSLLELYSSRCSLVACRLMDSMRTKCSIELLIASPSIQNI